MLPKQEVVDVYKRQLSLLSLRSLPSLLLRLFEGDAGKKDRPAIHVKWPAGPIAKVICFHSARLYQPCLLYTSNTVRLSIGTEHIEDLLEDLSQALEMV